jgi:thioredoxin 2
MEKIVSCLRCGTKNRVKTNGDARGPRPVCGKCKAPLLADPTGAPGRPIDLTDDSFDRVLGEAGRPVLVDFWAPWCGHCRTLAPVVEQFAGRHGNVLVAKLNTEENPRTPARFGVRGIPTMILFENGKEAARLSGAMPLPALEQQLGRWL